MNARHTHTHTHIPLSLSHKPIYSVITQVRHKPLSTRLLPRPRRAAHLALQEACVRVEVGAHGARPRAAPSPHGVGGGDGQPLPRRGECGERRQRDALRGGAKRGRGDGLADSDGVARRLPRRPPRPRGGGSAAAPAAELADEGEEDRRTEGGGGDHPPRHPPAEESEGREDDLDRDVVVPALVRVELAYEQLIRIQSTRCAFHLRGSSSPSGSSQSAHPAPGYASDGWSVGHDSGCAT